MKLDREEKIVAGAFLAIVAFVVVGFVAVARSDARESAAWDRFRAAHACRVVGQIKGGLISGSGVGFDSKGGVVPTFTSYNVPDKTSWFCDDGITYTR